MKMSRNASAIVLAGNGTNCEMETAFACRGAGFERVDIVTIWELIAGEKTLEPYDFMCLPGGFLDGDDLGSAKAQANRLLHSTVKKNGVAAVRPVSFFYHERQADLGNL
jgi:phosphoribosylformylglycinamidine synthase